ncbi:MAG TPA: DUF1080 domain-containing protein [Blastocatellia bacterium]|nr:DUF1080 domain-containing protein [Blastocatellia bacterium]
MKANVAVLFLLLSILAILPGNATNSVSAVGRGARQKTKQLFNGKNMDGWEHVGPGRFVVENGLLRTEGHMGLLWYTGEKFGNCTIKVVYKTSEPDSNSGVFIRIADRPADEWFAVHHGYEVQICDHQDDYHTTGAIYSLSKVTARPVKKPGEWNTMEITLKGPVVIVSINGVEVNRFDPAQPMPERKESWEPERGPRPETGYIGLQNHDDKDSHVYFKEISVRY